MDRPLVSVLIVSRGRVARLRECVRSIERQDYTRREIRVLANGCAETAAAVRAEFPGVELLETPANVGSAPGRNVVACGARGEWLLFLDDDGELKSPDAISRLVAAAATDPRAALLSMSLYDADTDEPTGWRLTQGRLRYRCYHASFAGGACLVRRRAFEEAGGYCETFTGPSEEFDLTVRLYAAGWAVVHFPDVAFHHHVEKTEEDWRRRVSEGYQHLQYTIWRLFPAPWHVPASAKALATALWIDLRHHRGAHLGSEVRGALAWMRSGRRDRRPLPVRAIERLYFAKYYRVDSWETLERAPRGFLARVLLARLRRKRAGVAKLPLPARVAAVDTARA